MQIKMAILGLIGCSTEPFFFRSKTNVKTGKFIQKEPNGLHFLLVAKDRFKISTRQKLNRQLRNTDASFYDRRLYDAKVIARVSAVNLRIEF